MSKENLTREEVRERYLALEKEGKFDQHVDPIDMSIVIPVTKDYHYYPQSIGESLSKWLRYNFVVKPYSFYVNHHYLETKVVGRENLKGIKKAIVTSNHVQMFDCLALKKAMHGHYLNIVAASFNNFKGSLGDGMRSAGMLPLPESLEGMPSFEKAIKKSFDKNHYVLFFPEQSEWWYYEKVRPFKDGAFHFALKNDVPVVPCFISFEERKKKIKDPIGMYPKRMIIHILKPIYPSKEEIPYLEKRSKLAEAAFNETKECYESVYHKPLSYK
ncbi:MAG: 1-acyl-sn-glycerol-3-phosphate acyltransferase [Bacilli bacterium]|jgi:1-acyl-sn-glycerol-3-phosphate acyltransferase|nr:1-acyl-sn-glycerol-3-phosphate acyltransferase [Bacilli bacterium]MCH4211074.1 1-acyl-sn-glycerol-3-phosphate acyltransferase [Bacilli bacterium]MCI2054773.1 1-acyl-sn-glycerol-3-phosphate acyltransferase [Bacilli bacterium]